MQPSPNERITDLELGEVGDVGAATHVVVNVADLNDTDAAFVPLREASPGSLSWRHLLEASPGGLSWRRLEGLWKASRRPLDGLWKAS